MFPSGSEPGEQQKEDGFGSRLRQSDGLLMVENSQPCANSKQGESARGRRKRERELNEMMGKGGSIPPYIGQGGCHPPPTSHVVLNQRGRSGCAIWRVAPSLGTMGQGGRLPPSP